MNHRPIALSMVLSALVVPATLLSAGFTRHTRLETERQLTHITLVNDSNDSNETKRLLVPGLVLPEKKLTQSLISNTDASVAGFMTDATGQQLNKAKVGNGTIQISVRLQPQLPSIAVLSPAVTQIRSVKPTAKRDLALPSQSQALPSLTPTLHVSEHEQDSTSETTKNKSSSIPIQASPTPQNALETNSNSESIIEPIPASLLDQVNHYRNGLRLGKLSSRVDLCQVAQERVVELASDFSHHGFRRRLDDGSLQSLNYQGIAENIWYSSGEITPQIIVDDWDKSTPHREALRGDWQWGCGVIANGYAVFLFMR